MAVIAGILNVTAYTLYSSQILFGDTKPSIVAWIVWGFLVILNVSSYMEMSKDWVMSVVPAASAGACLITTIVVLSKGGSFGTLGVVDWIALSLGLVACIVWGVKKKADYANMIIVGAVAIGFVPIYYGITSGTVHETPFCWFLWTISYLLSAKVVLLRWKEEPEKKNRAQIVYPAACVVLHLVVALMVI